jgi:hypothetical protein
VAATPTQTQSRYSQHPRNLHAADQARITLGRNACGVLLELEERQSNGPRVVVVTAFTQVSSFEDWCTNDPLRFEAPVVHQQARRDADALWRNDP